MRAATTTTPTESEFATAPDVRGARAISQSAYAKVAQVGTADEIALLFGVGEASVADSQDVTVKALASILGHVLDELERRNSQ